MKSFLRIKMIKTENESDAAALSQMQEKNTNKVLILMNNNSFYSHIRLKLKTPKVLKYHVVDRGWHRAISIQTQQASCDFCW